MLGQAELFFQSIFICLSLLIKTTRVQLITISQLVMCNVRWSFFVIWVKLDSDATSS